MEANCTTLENISPYGFIEDWYTLGVATGIKPKLLSHVLRNRDDMQTRLRRNGRWVYQSDTYLKVVQTRLMPLLYGLLEHFNHDHIISYIPGKSPQQALQECTGYKHQIKFDIKGYYDHVRLRHITEALKSFGFSDKGARLVGRYTVVKRRIGGTDDNPKTISTLQQGSVLSPMMSNIVGHHFIDKPIMDYIDTHFSRIRGLRYKYLRYSDNCFLFLDGSTIPLDALANFKAFVKDTLRQSRLFTHKWQTIASSHPKRNQSALGIVLNHEARVCKHLFNRTRATLFNACTKGLRVAAEEYWERHLWLEYDSVPLREHANAKMEAFKASIQGKASYISSVNAMHGLQLTKLLNAVSIINSAFASMPVGSRLPDGVFAALKRHRNFMETTDEYVLNLEDAVTAHENASMASAA